MKVLAFQIAILAIMLIFGSFGNAARNKTAILLVIFTIVMVFMSWLIILQLITIFAGYTLSQNLSDSNSKDGAYSLRGCIIIIGIIGIIVLIFSTYDNSEKVEPVDYSNQEKESLNSLEQDYNYKTGNENSLERIQYIPSNSNEEVNSDSVKTYDYRYDDEHGVPSNEVIE